MRTEITMTKKEAASLNEKAKELYSKRKEVSKELVEVFITILDAKGYLAMGYKSEHQYFKIEFPGYNPSTLYRIWRQYKVSKELSKEATKLGFKEVTPSTINQNAANAISKAVKNKSSKDRRAFMQAALKSVDGDTIKLTDSMVIELAGSFESPAREDASKPTRTQRTKDNDLGQESDEDDEAPVERNTKISKSTQTKKGGREEDRPKAQTERVNSSKGAGSETRTDGKTSKKNQRDPIDSVDNIAQKLVEKLGERFRGEKHLRSFLDHLNDSIIKEWNNRS